MLVCVYKIEEICHDIYLKKIFESRKNLVNMKFLVYF